MCVGLSIHGVGEYMCIHIFMYKIHKYWQIDSEAYCNSLCFKKIPVMGLLSSARPTGN